MYQSSIDEMELGLYVSHSQIFTYLNCGLKYQFQYVENRPQERKSASLFLGTALHSALSRYYRTHMEKGTIEPVAVLKELFEDCISLEIDGSDMPVIYKSDAPDKANLIEQGKSLLDVFHQATNLDGFRVIGVEFPIKARLFTDTGEPTDFNLFGIVDLLLLDERDNSVLIVDHKSLKNKPTQDALEENGQFSAYAYLLAANRFIPAKDTVRCRQDVLRKLKTPTLEYFYTERTAENRRRFAKISNAVLQGIESRTFIPNKGWMCSDCQYSNACKAW